jgi:cyclophilin family peptidyl-prolyl cis-trans isomerase
MLYLSLGVAAFLGLGVLCAVDASAADGDNPIVVLDTTAGPIAIELDKAKAPVTVENFLGYVDSGFYNGLVFHRVIPGFMIQGGGMDENLREKATKAPIQNEAGNGLTNKRGTIAMARTNNPDSATAQFFINLKDNNFLNRSPGSAGYAVFGTVVDGMDAVDEIAKVQTGSKGGHEDVPLKPVVIKSAKRKTKS